MLTCTCVRERLYDDAVVVRRCAFDRDRRHRTHPRRTAGGSRAVENRRYVASDHWRSNRLPDNASITAVVTDFDIWWRQDDCGQWCRDRARDIVVGLTRKCLHGDVVDAGRRKFG